MAAPTAAAGTLENLALGRGASVVAGSASGASPSTLTDGVFRPAGTQWQNGTVWWSGTSTLLEIGLGGPVEVAGAVVQADNNDTYRMWCRDIVTGNYVDLWTIDPVGGAGMRTRPNQADNGQIFSFDTSGWNFRASLRYALRISSSLALRSTPSVL